MYSPCIPVYSPCIREPEIRAIRATPAREFARFARFARRFARFPQWPLLMPRGRARLVGCATRTSSALSVTPRRVCSAEGRARGARSTRSESVTAARGAPRRTTTDRHKTRGDRRCETKAPWRSRQPPRPAPRRAATRQTLTFFLCRDHLFIIALDRQFFANLPNNQTNRTNRVNRTCKSPESP